jgi:hypothetical protein
LKELREREEIVALRELEEPRELKELESKKRVEVPSQVTYLTVCSNR